MGLPRIHCHSAFKHYEMYHCNQSSGYGNSIFNTTYNFNGGDICGGGFWGGLFGGLGMGLGAGLMNMFTGGMNMFSGMNMFGGGIGMFGGGFPMMNFWGMGGGSSQNVDGAGGKSKAKAKDNDNDNKECPDKDNEIRIALRDKLQKLGEQTTITQAEIDTLKAEIQKAKDETDENHNDTDKTEYDQLLKDLEKIKPKGAPAQTSVAEDKDDSGESTRTDVQTDTQVTETPTPAPAPAPTPTVTGNLTDKASGDLSPEEIKQLTAAQAIEILGNDKNKRLNADDTVKVPRTYNELLLAWKSGLKIQFCKNTDSENDSKKSATISGNITGEISPYGSDGDKMYKAKVKDTYGEYELVFNFNENNNTIEIISANGAKVEYEDNDGNSVTKDLTTVSTGNEGDKYHIGEEWATRTGNPLVR